MQTKMIHKVEFKPINQEKEYLDNISDCSSIIEKGIQMSNEDISDVIEKMISVLFYRKNT